jgi:hypothetical protein
MAFEPPDTTPSPRPSVSAQIKTAAASPLTPIVALITALTGAIGAWQAYQESQTRPARATTH